MTTLWQKLSAWMQPDPEPDAATAQAIAHALERIDPMLRSVADADRRLSVGVGHALDYCASLVSRLPPPVDVGGKAFGMDPLVHALFASADDIGLMLGRSEAVHDFLASGDHAFAIDCYALLGMRRQEKTVLGMARQGDVIQRDTPRHLVYFSDHTLRELSGSLEELQGRLRIAAFDSLLLKYGERLQQQRQARDEVRLAWEAERSSGRGALSADEKAWRLSSLAQRYEDATAALAPERILDDLNQWFQAPETVLYLQDYEVTLDSLGIVGDAASEHTATLHCQELVGRDRRRWTLLLVRISCPEARDAVASRNDRDAALRSLLI